MTTTAQMTAEVAKRLSFGDMTRNAPDAAVLKDLTEIINNLRNPSLDEVVK